MTILCPTCPADCSQQATPDLVDISCGQGLLAELEEISGLVFTTEFDESGDPVGAPTDPTDAVALAASISNAGAGKWRYLPVSASLKIEEGTEIELSKDLKIPGTQEYTLEAAISLPGNVPGLREGLRKMCGGQIALFYHTPKSTGVAGIYGSDASVGTPTNVDGMPIKATSYYIRFPHATGDGVLKANMTIKWKANCAPARLGLWPLA